MRKTKEIKIDDSKSRDFGKRFRVTEMSARQFEDFGFGIICALIKGGANIPESVHLEQMGELVKRKGLGIFAGIDANLIKPYYDKLLNCVEYLGKLGEKIVVQLDNNSADEIIEDVSTLLLLRMEALLIHWDFPNQDKG